MNRDTSHLLEAGFWGAVIKTYSAGEEGGSQSINEGAGKGKT